MNYIQNPQTPEKKLHIVSISDGADKNGVVSFIKIFADNIEYFADKSIEIDISLYKNEQKIFNESKGNSDKKNKENHKKLDVLSFIKRHINNSSMLSFLYICASMGLRALIATLKTLNRKKIEQIYFYQDFLCAAFGLFLHNKNYKKILILHSGSDALSQLLDMFPAIKHKKYEYYLRDLLRFVMSKQTHIVTLNKDYSRFINTELGKNKAECIYNCTTFKENELYRTNPSFLSSNETLKMIAVGSLQHRKGFDLLINAIALLPQQKRMSVHLTIIGEGIERKNLEKLIKKRNLNSQISLIGSQTNVLSYMHMANLFILPSRDEGLPIALIEACSAGLPIMTTDVGSINEIFKEGDCIFIDKNSKSISEKINLVIDNLNSLRELSIKSQKIYELNFKLEKFLEHYTSLFLGKQSNQ